MLQLIFAQEMEGHLNIVPQLIGSWLSPVVQTECNWSPSILCLTMSRRGWWSDFSDEGRGKQVIVNISILYSMQSYCTGFRFTRMGKFLEFLNRGHPERIKFCVFSRRWIKIWGAFGKLGVWGGHISMPIIFEQCSNYQCKLEFCPNKIPTTILFNYAFIRFIFCLSSRKGCVHNHLVRFWRYLWTWTCGPIFPISVWRSRNVEKYAVPVQ